MKKRIINCKNKERIILIENYMPIKNFVYEDLSSLVSKNQFYRFLRYIIEKEKGDRYNATPCQNLLLSPLAAK